ncbi:type II toxin-antitoxin system RelB family antitoxin [Varibaculum massiliense]|uniref:type II toxin-antitoxin system RelB family antitoxin n=1 Tax=Varibaculum massiliense TaxID=1852372 RepID=UPI0028895470|nr:ribbon-helix-helix domain-containing protein [Varibaculum massiliense]
MNMVKAVNTVTTSVRLPVDLVERYDNLAKATGRSRTYYVTEALEESIAQLEYQYGLLKKVEDYRAGRLETVSIDQLEDHLGLGD